MRRALTVGCFAALFVSGAACGALAQQTPPPPAASAHGPVTIDGIAARIEGDIITDSEVQELAAFQELVDGRAKSRDELIRELADQWIVRQEAAAITYSQPSKEDVDNAYQQLVKQFPSSDEFKRRREALALTEEAARRMVDEQLYLSRYLDHRFRPAAQVTQEQIEAYYENEFAPQLKARGEVVPPLDDVEDTIREVLIQRTITEQAEKWLDDVRERLKVEIVSHGASS